MTNPDFPFGFDINFSFGREGVFSVVNNEAAGSEPPVSGTFLLLDDTSFLLLSGEDFVLL